MTAVRGMADKVRPSMADKSTPDSRRYQRNCGLMTVVKGRRLLVEGGSGRPQRALWPSKSGLKLS